MDYTIVDPKVLWDQFTRIQFMKYFPKKLEEVAAYRTEFNRVMGRCKSDAMAVMVITEWIDNNTDRPTFSELAQLISKHVINLQDSNKSDKRETKCAKCAGDGSQWRGLHLANHWYVAAHLKNPSFAAH